MNTNPFCCVASLNRHARSEAQRRTEFRVSTGFFRFPKHVDARNKSPHDDLIGAFERNATEIALLAIEQTL